jgi:hypothetical protein
LSSCCSLDEESIENGCEQLLQRLRLFSKSVLVFLSQRGEGGGLHQQLGGLLRIGLHRLGLLWVGGNRSLFFRICLSNRLHQSIDHSLNASSEAFKEGFLLLLVEIPASKHLI